METIGMLNTISFLLILATIVALFYKLFTNFSGDNTLIFIIISFVVLLLVTATNVLEHFDITNYFDLFEDELKILFIPLFIFASFSYCLKKELSENKRKEQSIKENNVRLNTSMEGADQALWEWHSNHNTFIINKNYCFLDFEPYTYIIDENNWKDIIHHESKYAYKKLVNAIESGNVLPGNTEIKIKTFYGNYKWVLIRGKKTNQTFENYNITYFGTIIDVDNLKQVQVQLNEARIKAVESERLKSAFLNNISHEIRTPMNAIMGFSDLIIEHGVNQELQIRYMKIIVQGCEKLIQIVEDLIEMSQIVVGAVHVDKMEILAGSIIKEINKKYLHQADQKGLRLYCNANETLQFVSDETKLVRILGNLIDNAIKYTSEGEIEYGIIDEGSNVRFFVRDTGIGIQPELKNIVFEYFRQLEPQENKLHGGSGLGLSICKGLVSALGGRIWIESEAGKGTMVSFILPNQAASLKQETKKPKLSKKIPGKPLKVLIAEDEETNFLYLREILKTKAVSILWAKNGQEAIEMVNNNPDISIIFMDIKMPVLDGYMAAIKIKKTNPDIPIVAQTAYSINSSVESYSYGYFDEYLTKPIDKLLVFQALENFLGTGDIKDKEI